MRLATSGAWRAMCATRRSESTRRRCHARFRAGMNFDETINEINQEVKKGIFSDVIKGNPGVMRAYGAGDKEKDCTQGKEM